MRWLAHRRRWRGSAGSPVPLRRSDQDHARWASSCRSARPCDGGGPAPADSVQSHTGIRRTRADVARAPRRPGRRSFGSTAARHGVRHVEPLRGNARPEPPSGGSSARRRRGSRGERSGAGALRLREGSRRADHRDHPRRDRCATGRHRRRLRAIRRSCSSTPGSDDRAATRRRSSGRPVCPRPCSAHRPRRWNSCSNERSSSMVHSTGGSPRFRPSHRRSSASAPTSSTDEFGVDRQRGVVQAPPLSDEVITASTNASPATPSDAVGNDRASGSGSTPARRAAIASAASEVEVGETFVESLGMTGDDPARPPREWQRAGPVRGADFRRSAEWLERELGRQLLHPLDRAPRPRHAESQAVLHTSGRLGHPERSACAVVDPEAPPA